MHISTPSPPPIPSILASKDEECSRTLRTFSTEILNQLSISCLLWSSADPDINAFQDSIFDMLYQEFSAKLQKIITKGESNVDSDVDMTAASTTTAEEKYV